MTLQQKVQLLYRDYSAQDIANKLTELSGRPVPVSTVYAYGNGQINDIRIKAVKAALDRLVEGYEA